MRKITTLAISLLAGALVVSSATAADLPEQLKQLQVARDAQVDGILAEIGITEEQAKQVAEIRAKRTGQNEHRDKIRALRSERRVAQAAKDEAQLAKIKAELAELQSSKVPSIRSVLTPEQQTQFDKLNKEALDALRAENLKQKAAKQAAE
jgi:Spy/CpxP family protein refolding chaperone